MAKRPPASAQQAPQMKGLSELWARIRFLFLALVIFRLGSHVPIPNINPDQLNLIFNQNQGTVLAFLNMFSGGALSRMSIFALGVMPYISASIIMQLMTAVSPQLEQLKKEGEQGRHKITQMTRYLTVVLGSVQALGMAIGLTRQEGLVMLGSGGEGYYAFLFVATLTLVSGTMFLLWLGELINERGIGNGISILIFAGIVAGIPTAIGQTVESARQGELSLLVVLIIALVAVTVVGVVVFVEKAQRRITVNYAKRQQGRKVFAAQQTHLPLKVNMAGVIPAIFASSILLFPASIAQFAGGPGSAEWLQDLTLALSPGQPLYIILFAAGIIFFCYFYTALMFNPKEVAENLKRSGAFIPGIRPGEQSAKYIDGVLSRLTLVGAVYMTAICLLPLALNIWWDVPFYLGGTSLLIAVVVVMDLMAQINAHLVSSQYEQIMKKTNMKNYGSSGLLR